VAAVSRRSRGLRAADAALLEDFHFDGRSVREIATAAGASGDRGRLRRARRARGAAAAV
jgi:hypothetical protein